MAANLAAAIKICNALEEVANQRLVLHNLEIQLAEYNADININWGSPPGFLTLDGDGNISGKSYTPGDVSNALGSITQDRNMMTNAAVSQGDHLANFNKVGSPLG